jgi:cell division septation protein DedD
VTVEEEGFHEIQLNGKQVVFLFMAATVVSVVIFLCGVLVGRGVRVDRGPMGDVTPMSAQAETSPPLPAQPAPVAATPAGSDPRAAAPPPDTDDLSYFNRLETKTPPRENLKAALEKKTLETNTPQTNPVEKFARADAAADKPIVDKPAAPKPIAPPERVAPPPQKVVPPPQKETPRVAPAPAPPASPILASAPEEPVGAGFAVQIAALNVRGEAEAIAKRLSSKGYMAYVLVPSDGTPSVFRVRIGKFSTRHEAETVAAKLKKEEQFNPWVTR